MVTSRQFFSFLLFPCMLTCMPVMAHPEGNDSTGIITKDYSGQSHFSYTLSYLPGKTLATDTYVKDIIKKQANHSIIFETRYRPTLPPEKREAKDDFDSHYNYPSINIGLRYNFNRGTTLQREGGKDWEPFQASDYATHLGDAISLYGKFIRPFFRYKRVECSYYLGAGLGYSWDIYNRKDGIDNELVGSHMSIYFTGGLSAEYRIDKNWSVIGAIDFSHHSNGALNRPNKGANYFGPSLGLAFTPQAKQDEDNSDNTEKKNTATKAFNKYWYTEVTLGFGGKTLLEDWNNGHDLPKDDPDYRTEHYKIYSAYSMQLALMNRYSLCYASGLALDVFYGSYSGHIKRLDEEAGRQCKHSPWSIALAAKQDFFYKNFTMHGAIGYYLYREMGYRADLEEKPYYERIGLSYTFPKLYNISAGFSVKAHLGKADVTEFQLVVPIKL